MVQLASQFTAPVGGGGSSISAAGVGPSPSPLTGPARDQWLIESAANLSILPIAFEPIDRQSDK
jgi:hypothetical protein